LLRLINLIEDGQVRKVSVFLLIVESITDNVLIRYPEALIVDLHIHHTAFRFAEKGADSDGPWFSLGQSLDQIVDR
jgi:hypothetical protein